MGLTRPDDDDAPGPRLVDSDEETMRDLERLVAETPPLSGVDLERLLERSALGDKVSQERLVAANLGLVIQLAAHHEAQGLSMPDLVQEGSIGLVEAVRTFTGRGQGDFAAFAERCIGAQMDQAIAVDAVGMRDAELLIAAATDYEHTQMVMRRELHRTPTDGELAENC